MTPPRDRLGDDGNARGGDELEMAARVADNAADEAVAGADTPLDEQLTWRKDDSDYQQALDDIAVLVAMRREVSRAAFSKRGVDDEQEPDTMGAWGPFEIVERLGGGASGEVYKARDKRLDNHVALKLFHRERVASVEHDTLLVEGRQHALVKHPNIAVIHGADENDGRVGIWMEYIDGSTLQELVEKQGTFGAGEAVYIARELCSALAAVHQRGLTHGDIKAQNVMREKGGRIVLMDFSSSRQIELEAESSGGLAGTPIYMAPELFDGKPPDVRSDIYSLGVLMFYLVTGRHPYEAQNLRGLKEAVAGNKPLLLDDLRSDLPPGFIRAVHKAIAGSPEDRFQSAGELQAALRDALAAEPSDNLPVFGEAAPDLKPLVRAARVVTGSILVTAFLALIGYANEIQYNVVLHVPDNFTDYSLGNAVVIGLRSLVISLFFVILEIVSLLVIWGLLTTVSPRAADALRGFGRKIVNRLRRIPFDELSTVLGVVCVLSLAGAHFFLGDLLALLVTLAEVGGPRGIDVSILETTDYHERLVLLVTHVALVLAMGWLIVFRQLVPREGVKSTARLMKWVSAAAIIVSLVIMASPWRLVWKNESLPVWIGETKGYLVAERDDEWFVYVPEAGSSREHFVIDRDDPRITRVGESPENIFRGS